MTRTMVATAALALALGAAPAVAQTSTTTTTTQSGTAEAGKLAEADQKFVEKVAQDGIAEADLGALAKERAKSDEVKQFAQRMIDDHGKANEELKGLGAKKGFTVPAQLDADHREDLEELTRLTGAELDKKYIDEMVDDHEDDVEEFRDASKEAKDADVRAWAAKTLPILEEHLAEAKKLKERLGG